jgi:tetratricopeptide (TPR) repeat protein
VGLDVAAFPVEHPNTVKGVGLRAARGAALPQAGVCRILEPPRVVRRPAAGVGYLSAAPRRHRVKVFLSSTAQDLVAYRKVADDTILRLSQQAVATERFGPLPGEPVAECERKARESDVMVCVVAHRYGFVPEKGKGSITRREVEAAKGAGKDVLVWIVDDAQPWTEKKEQDLLTDPTVLADPARIAEVAEGVRALGEFKAWLRATFTVETFTTPDDLGRKIAVALSSCAQNRRRHVRTPAPTQGDVRVVHALQPAPHFHGRDALVKDLTDWVADLASPDRVWSLVAAGGTGKTAVAERVVRDMQPGEANVLVWSFYERPDADAFLRECNQLFLGEEEGPAGGRLERLERGLRDGRPHLIVLDGLERVQEEAGGGRVRGELSDQTLKLLLRALAAGLGRARALVTSRFPLVDLQDWTNRGYRETRMDDLTLEAAVAVLRDWGVAGEEVALQAVAAQVGNHALSVAVIGSYLHSFAGGHICAVAEFDLNAVTGDDPKAAKLARVLAFYAERLPPEERELLARLSVFPRGVTLELLSVLVDAGGNVAGLLVDARPRLAGLLNSLRQRGLVFQYRVDASVTWTAHPFLRDSFRKLLGCPAEQVFDVVAGSLSAGLERRPVAPPTESTVLDRYEWLIEATRLAGREEEAFELYWYGMGSYHHFAKRLGEYQRGYRTVAAFSTTGHPEDLAPKLAIRRRSLLANELALFARKLGRLGEASAIHRVDNVWKSSLGERDQISIGLQNSSDVAFARGRLTEAHALANAAVAEARLAGHNLHEESSRAYRGIAAHALGDIAAARADFAAATALRRRPLVSLRGAWHARHHLDLGEIAEARILCDHGMVAARRNEWNHNIPWFYTLLACIALTEGQDPTRYVDEVRDWTSRTGDVEYIIEAHLLTARHLLAHGDPQAAFDEIEAGLLNAVSCEFGLLRIELLVVLARIRLAWPDPPRAIRAAREAIDLAAHPDCRYAWGEADAAQAWGEAYIANHEPTLAMRAFERALAVRRRIEHPGAAETERWLACVG